MGGMVAVEFAAKYPSLSAAAVLISSGVLFPVRPLLMKQMFLRDCEVRHTKTRFAG
jgi:pimeloyl-ACP methyl ester carboxylesterase